MSIEQSTARPTFPPWVETSLFEPVVKDIVADFKQITNFKVNKSGGAGENFNTALLHIEIEVELKDGSSKTLSFMLKTAHDNDMARMMLQVHNVFEIERDMYAEVIPEMEQLYKEAGVEMKFVAKSYELATDNPYILLEDLRPKGFKNVNRVEGLDMDHTKAVLVRMAQWHAASAVRVATKGPYNRNIATGQFKEELRDMMIGMFAGLAPIFLECAKKFDADEEYFEAFCNMQSNLVNDMEKGMHCDQTEFNVLNHGDLWCNNVMFQHDAFGKIKETFLIDFQLPKYGSPANDLYYFLLTSTKYEIKIKEFDYFIKFYHDHLVENLKLLNYTKKIPTLRDIHVMLYKNTEWACVTINTTMAGALLDPNEDATAEILFGDSDAGLKMKMQLYSNPRYRKHLKLVLPWLYNRGALNA